jgi:hypothetical protein
MENRLSDDLVALLLFGASSDARGGPGDRGLASVAAEAARQLAWSAVNFRTTARPSDLVASNWGLRSLAGGPGRDEADRAPVGSPAHADAAVLRNGAGMDISVTYAGSNRSRPGPGAGHGVCDGTSTMGGLTAGADRRPTLVGMPARLATVTTQVSDPSPVQVPATATPRTDVGQWPFAPRGPWGLPLRALERPPTPRRTGRPATAACQDARGVVGEVGTLVIKGSADLRGVVSRASGGMRWRHLVNQRFLMSATCQGGQ